MPTIFRGNTPFNLLTSALGPLPGDPRPPSGSPCAPTSHTEKRADPRKKARRKAEKAARRRQRGR